MRPRVLVFSWCKPSFAGFTGAMLIYMSWWSGYIYLSVYLSSKTIHDAFNLPFLIHSNSAGSFRLGIGLVSLLCCASHKWASWKVHHPLCRKITLQGYVLQHDGWITEGFIVQDQTRSLLAKAQQEYLCCERSAGQRHRNEVLHPFELYI